MTASSRRSARGMLRCSILLVPLLAGCGAVEGLYKSRSARCKVNCENNADGESNDRNNVRETALPSLDFSAWHEATLTVVGADRTRRAIIKELSASEASLAAFLSNNPFLEHKGFLSLPAVFNNITDGAQSFRGVSPDSAELATDSKRCLAAAFWAPPQRDSLGLGGILNLGRCIPLNQRTQPGSDPQSFVASTAFDMATEVFVDGGASSPEHMSDLLQAAPFLWNPVVDENINLSFVAKKIIKEDTLTVRNNQAVEKGRWFQYTSMGGAEGGAFTFSYDAASHTTKVHGRVDILATDIPDPASDGSYNSKYGMVSLLAANFSNFTISGTDVVANKQFGFTKNASLSGTYDVMIDDLVLFRFEANGQPCVVTAWEISQSESGGTVRTNAGVQDLCATLR